MPFKFHCFRCGQRISALEEDQETEAVCPGCGRSLTVPRLAGDELVMATPKVPHPAPIPTRRISTLVVSIVVAVIVSLAAVAAVLLHNRGEVERAASGNATPAAKKPKKAAPESKPAAAVEPAKAEESEPAADVPPPETEQVLGGSRLSVNALLGDWKAGEGRKIPPNKQMIIYSREVDMIVTFQDDRAIGAIVTTRAGEPPLTRSQYFEFIRLVGHAAAEEDIKREDDGIVQFSVGEN